MKGLVDPGSEAGMTYRMNGMTYRMPWMTLGFCHPGPRAGVHSSYDTRSAIYMLVRVMASSMKRVAPL
jgi:hypothetical protein